MRQLEQTAVVRGGSRVLAAASLSLPESGTMGLVGVNGAGKSTLFAALTGVLDAAAGRIAVSGCGDVSGYAPQQPTFPEWLRVEDVARLFGLEFDDVARSYPGLLLDELRARSAGALSVGQRQALSVGVALALDAPLTLLDEPFAPLDFRRRVGLVRTLQHRRTHAGLTVISSQAAVDLLDTCDWIVVLREGHYVHSTAAIELTGGAADPALARQRFEDAVMALLDDGPSLQGTDA